MIFEIYIHYQFYFLDPIQSIELTTDIDTDSERMNIINAIIFQLNPFLDAPNKVKLVSSPSKIDSDVSRMGIFNDIYSSIGSLTSHFDSISSTEEVDTDLERKEILNGIIATVNNYSKFH